MYSDVAAPRGVWAFRRRSQRRACWLRIMAWTALLGATGLLVRGESRHPEVPDGAVAYTSITYRRTEGRRALLDLYVPAGRTPLEGRPAIVAIHGGGWCGGSRRDYGRQVVRLTRYGYVVVAVDYRLSRPGEPSWPGNLEDVREAVRWLRRHADEYGVDPDRIAAMGASAGGHLAALLGTCSDDPEARVSAVVDFYGPTDLLAISGPTRMVGGPIDLLLGDLPERRPTRAAMASPVWHVTADDPPMLLIHGQRDRLVPPDQSRRLAQALARAGVRHRLIVLEDEAHNFHLNARSRDDLCLVVLEFLREAWKHREETQGPPKDLGTGPRPAILPESPSSGPDSLPSP